MKWRTSDYKAKTAQRAKPLKKIRPSHLEFEPDTSPTGPWAVSGDELPGIGLGGLLDDGNIPGDSAGVAGTVGVAAVAGTSA